MAIDGRSPKQPLVSVVLPTYDRPEYLREAVRSVEEQTYPNVELVVVDDCSPTPAERTLRSVDTGTLSVRCLRHEENRGANAARNTGIEASNGTLVAFLDDDDRWLPSKLAKQVAAFDRDDEIGLVYTGQRYVDENGRTTEVRTPSTRGDATEAILRGASVGPFSTLMVEADAIEAAGLPDERFPSLQDKEWILRISQQFHIEPVEEPLVVRGVHAADQISDDYERRRDVTYPLFIEKHRPLAASFGVLTERLFVANLSTSLAASAVSNGYYREGVRFSIRAIRAYPLSIAAFQYLLISIGGKYTYRPAQMIKRTAVRYRDRRS